MSTNPSWLTIRQAAEALGVSVRTVRRRIKEGDLSATKRLRGKQEIWIIDGAELARYAQSTGQQLTMGSGKSVQQGARGPGAPAVVNADHETEALPKAAEVDRLRAELGQQHLTNRALVQERDYLRERLTQALEQVSGLTTAVSRLALPAAPGQMEPTPPEPQPDSEDTSPARSPAMGEAERQELAGADSAPEPPGEKGPVPDPPRGRNHPILADYRPSEWQEAARMIGQPAKERRPESGDREGHRPFWTRIRDWLRED